MGNFPTRLGMLIKDSGMTQKEFAQKSGITEAAISRYVNGNRLPNMAALVMLKNALGCSWEQLMEE